MEFLASSSVLHKNKKSYLGFPRAGQLKFFQSFALVESDKNRNILTMIVSLSFVPYQMFSSSGLLV